MYFALQCRLTNPQKFYRRVASVTSAHSRDHYYPSEFIDILNIRG